jgi:hypothetical protein
LVTVEKGQVPDLSVMTLLMRLTGTRFSAKRTKKMSWNDAMMILDKVREGQSFPLYLINEALMLTGDLDE